MQQFFFRILTPLPPQQPNVNFLKTPHKNYMNFRLTPPLFSIFLKDQNIKKWSRYYIFLKILRLKKVVTLLCTFGQVKKSGHNFLKTYILKNQPQLFKIHTYFEIRKTSLSKKNKKAMQTLRWAPPPSPHVDKHEQFSNPPPPEPVTQFMDAPLTYES